MAGQARGQTGQTGPARGQPPGSIPSSCCREAFLAPAQRDDRLLPAEQGNASRQGKPTDPCWLPVEDKMMSVVDLLPLPQEQEGEWQPARHRRKGREVTPPSPPPARPELSQQMWHKHRHDYQPAIEMGKRSGQLVSTTRRRPRPTSETRE